MDSNMRTVGRAGTHACGDTPCGGASAPSNVSQKQESRAFGHGERQKVMDRGTGKVWYMVQMRDGSGNLEWEVLPE